MKRNLFQSAGAQGITEGAGGSRSRAQGKEQALWDLTQLGTFSSQGPPLASLVLVPFTTVCTYSIALPLTECAPLFAHVPGGEMAIAAPALWGFSNRATTGFLEFASRF